MGLYLWSERDSEEVNLRRVRAAIVPVGGGFPSSNLRLFSFGGMDENAELTDSFWSLNVETGALSDEKREQPEWPQARTSHSLANSGNQIYLFGGTDSEGRPLADLWVYSVSEAYWNRAQTHGAKPAGQMGHSAVVWNRRMYLFGKTCSHSLDLDTLEWRIVGVGSRRRPTGRRWHTACIWGGSMWLFGGRDGFTTFGDLWKLDLETNVWEQPALVGPRITPRYEHVAVLLDSGIWIVHGGKDRSGSPLTDTLVVDLKSLISASVAHLGPPPAIAHFAFPWGNQMGLGAAWSTENMRISCWSVSPFFTEVINKCLEGDEPPEEMGLGRFIFDNDVFAHIILDFL